MPWLALLHLARLHFWLGTQAIAQSTYLTGTVVLPTRSRALAQVHRGTGAVTVRTSALTYNPQCA